MIMTKSRSCSQCPGKIRLIPSTDTPVDGWKGSGSVKICPQCGQEYIRSKNDLSIIRFSAKQ